MTDTLIDQKFSALDATQQQRVIDGLEKMGAQAGGKYAKALAERLKGGVENAAEDALSAITPVTDEDIANAVSGARKKEEEKQRRTKRKFKPAELGEIEIDIEGQMRKIRKSEAQAVEDGNQEVLNSLKARFEAEDRLRAQNEIKTREYYEKENEWRKRAGLALVGPKEYWQEGSPEDAMKTLGVFDSVLQEAVGAGKESAAAFTGGFHDAYMANPVAMPPIQPPAVDTSAMVQNIQAQAPRISQSIAQSLSGLKLTLPPDAMDGFFNGIIERVNTGTASVSLALSTAFSAIDLAPAGVTVAETFTNGLLSGIESSGFVLNLYEKIMAKFSGDISAAGGAR
jgi:hypothetical protein